MGFLNALCELGQAELSRHSGGAYDDIDSFLQMPMDLIEIAPDDEGSGSRKPPARLPSKEIQVWLDVADPQADCLDVKGVREIVLADFWSGFGNEREKKRRYLYRDPVSTAAQWRYAPIYKLGAGVTEGRKTLIGEDGWRTDKSTRFYKLYHSMLRAFEEQGVFSPGNADCIMSELENKADELASLWTEKKSSYILIFSPAIDGRFLYPAEVNGFLRHFRTRLSESNRPKSGSKPGEKTKQHVCAICQWEAADTVNMDKVFAFATFDKKKLSAGSERLGLVECRREKFSLSVEIAIDCSPRDAM